MTPSHVRQRQQQPQQQQQQHGGGGGSSTRPGRTALPSAQRAEVPACESCPCGALTVSRYGASWSTVWGAELAGLKGKVRAWEPIAGRGGGCSGQSFHGARAPPAARPARLSGRRSLLSGKGMLAWRAEEGWGGGWGVRAGGGVRGEEGKGQGEGEEGKRGWGGGGRGDGEGG